MAYRSSAFTGPTAGRVIAPTLAQPAVVAKIDGMVGDCAPLGFFDPLGFSTKADAKKMAQ